MSRNQKMIFLFAVGIIIIVILLITLNHKKSAHIPGAEKRIITESQILCLINSNIESLVDHFSFYKSNFEKVSEEITWVKNNLSPYVESYAKPVEKVLIYASILPVPWIDQLSNWSKKAVTMVVTASSLTSDFAVSSDSLNRLFREITELYKGYCNNNTRRNLLLIRDKVNLQLSDQMYGMRKFINSIQEVLGSAKDVVSLINDIREYLDKALKFINNLSKDDVSPELENPPSQMELLRLISDNQEIIKIINDKFSEDLELISHINSAFSILKDVFPDDY